MLNQRGFVNLDFTGLFLFFIAIGILLGMFATLGIPAVWELIKPFIHAWTA